VFFSRVAECFLRISKPSLASLLLWAISIIHFENFEAFSYFTFVMGNFYYLDRKNLDLTVEFEKALKIAGFA
jgi:hypothetical protein